MSVVWRRDAGRPRKPGAFAPRGERYRSPLENVVGYLCDVPGCGAFAETRVGWETGYRKARGTRKKSKDGWESVEVCPRCVAAGKSVVEWRPS